MYKVAINALRSVPPAVWYAGGALIAAYVVVAAIKKPDGQPLLEKIAEDVGAAIAGAGGSAVKGAAQGVILGIGDVVGLPRTNKTKCEEAMAAGDNFSASLHCDASTFLAWQKRGITNRFESFFGINN